MSKESSTEMTIISKEILFLVEAFINIHVQYRERHYIKYKKQAYTRLVKNTYWLGQSGKAVLVSPIFRNTLNENQDDKPLLPPVNTQVYLANKSLCQRIFVRCNSSQEERCKSPVHRPVFQHKA